VSEILEHDVGAGLPKPFDRAATRRHGDRHARPRSIRRFRVSPTTITRAGSSAIQPQRDDGLRHEIVPAAERRRAPHGSYFHRSSIQAMRAPR
jgi:hypothetical protein